MNASTEQIRPLYNDFTTFLNRHFDCKVQKISINAGFTCPNRDGSRGRGGCTYCNNQTFNPDYCHTDSDVTRQLNEGKEFFARKYPQMRYLAYFQAYTNTYAGLESLKRLYEEALSVDGVVGLVIGTRPDCMPPDLLNYLEQLSRQTFLLVEYGIETTEDTTLQRINRGHSFAETVRAVHETSERGILTGGHVILGLPGESRELMLQHPARLSALPLVTLKLHQLQIIRGTRMAREWRERPNDFYPIDTAEAYIDLAIDYVERLRPDLVIERFVSQSPKELLIAPDWGVKNHVFTSLLQKRMRQRGAYQGRLWVNSEKSPTFVAHS